MADEELYQPLLLYHDPNSGAVRATTYPPTVHIDADAFTFRGARFDRTREALPFWDYLVRENGDIVGVVLNDFDIDPTLASSSLLTASSNLRRDDYGYSIYLRTPNEDDEVDSSQAFGGYLFEHNHECVLFLSDWHRRGYAFSLDTGLIAPVE